ncbi:MAG: hypothetical protein C4334_07110 [Pyrinomonas sp.]
MGAESLNPVVHAVLSGAAPRQARLAAARGLLPLPQADLLEVLVGLRADADQEIARAAEESLHTQKEEDLLGTVRTSELSPRVLAYFASRRDLGRIIHEALVLNERTPDEAVLEIARATEDGVLLETIAINQQRLIRAPEIIEAILQNPARTPEAERRAIETRREFFEKERGARQIAEEMRARGLVAAAEFVEAAESTGTRQIAEQDLWLLAAHIEVSDVDLDDSWLPLEKIEELVEETEAQRASNVERIIAEMQGDEEIAPERISLIRRVMLMSVKDRVKLALKGDREVRNILIRDANKTVATAVMKNPRLTDHEVETIAAMRTVPEEVLRLIALNRSWARSYPIIHNLARNPRTPIPTAMNILPRLYAKDLRALAQNRNVSEAVRRQALRLAQTRLGE